MKKTAGKKKTTTATKPKRGRTRTVVPELVDGEVDGFDEARIPQSTDTSKSLSIADPMALYMAEIKKYPLLSPQDEYKWAVKYFETKDPRAAEMLVTSNLRFVVKVAAEYAKFGARMIDLVQEGNVGLMHAVRDFNPYKGVRVITYAVWWIRGYIQEFLMRQFSMVRLGTTPNQRKLFYQLQKERQKLEALGKDAGIKLLSTKLGIEESEIREMDQRMTNRDVSLDQPLGDESANTLMDFQSNSQQESIDDVLAQEQQLSQLRKDISEVKSKLNDKETYILENRILSDEPQTLQEIGNKFNMTRERARQLEARVLDKIRAAHIGKEGKIES